ncbi:hypothetical protein GGR54DRAFT_632128 [Hypoxylon sp. NC1633]|nr:hypothetical protein GGR54DRAFT_632128 [Hypoxylon sp. NC1633]
MDAAYVEPGRTAEYREPTLTFEPHESSTTSLKPPSRLAVLADNGNVLLSNLQHQRQQSAPNVSLSAADTRPRSPKRGHARHQSQGMPFTGDTRAGRRQDNSPGRLGGWLGSTSASSVDGRASPDVTPKSKRSIATADTTPKSTTQSRFGFLASSMSALTTRLTATQTPLSPQEVDDELCNMDIEAALYPSSPSSFAASSPTDRDTFSPAAYKNLQVNAAGLLHKMQDAYRQRTVALQEIQAEREAQREETEETELRVRHFKTQLESMAAKAAEQEDAMRRLVAELHAEKRARQRLEERSAREKILAAAAAAEGQGRLVTEDLGVDEEEEHKKRDRRRWRESGGTETSDLSVDTTDDGDSASASAESESIFSRCRSPTATAITYTTEGENPELRMGMTRTPPPASSSSLSTAPPQAKPAQLSTFQKLVKGISNGADGCSNCRGQDSSVAWNTVSLLRDENRSLKHRVAQLEVVVEGALDVVNGIGLP